MKKITYIIMILTTVLASCEQEEFNGTGLEGLREFTLKPIEGSRIELNSIDPNGEVVIAWDEARSGLKSVVNYTWIAYKTGGDASNPDLSLSSDNDGLDTQITFTNEQLDLALTDMGLAIGDEITLNWTVIATNGDVTKVADPALITFKRFVDQIAPFSLLTPSDEALIELNYETPDANILIKWESTFSGFSDDITYRWFADVQGGDFSAPLLELESDGQGIEAQVTFTNQELEDFLADQGVEVAAYYYIDWKVVASTADLSLQSSEVFTLQLRRFNPVATKYLVGAATPGGWGWDAPTEISEVSEGVFQGTLVFSNETFRIFNIKDDWGSGVNFPSFVNDGFTIDVRFENAGDGDQNFRFIGTPGEYTFTLDNNSKVIRLTVGDSKYMVGAATPGGWDWAAPTEMFQTSVGVWESTLVFTNDTFRFFEIKGDWGSGKNFPFYENDGYTIDANFENAGDGDQNFRFIGTSGEYKITMDSNTKTIILE